MKEKILGELDKEYDKTLQISETHEQERFKSDAALKQQHHDTIQ